MKNSNASNSNNKSSSTKPSRIGRYKILELLGPGGMDTVYRAYDPELGREVVVKLIPLLTLTNDDERRQRFEREVQIAGRLKHPNIVTVYDVELDREPPFMVMELLTGGTLMELLQQESLSWRDALVLLRPLLLALSYAHRLGVVHRALKPANVMFTGDEANTLKLVDFGLARVQDQEQVTQTGIVPGSATYMSPEQARAEKVSFQSDVFSFGIILYEAITGCNPLNDGAMTLAFFEAASDEQIDLTPLQDKAPAPVISLIRRAIAKRPELRYSNCEMVLADVDRCLLSDDRFLYIIST